MRIGNWTVLIAALEMAIREPNLYRQGVWARATPCGTVRCIAGWIAHFGGWLDDKEIPPMRDIFSVSNSVHTGVAIEHAALISLDLDPEFYGEVEPLDYDTWVYMDSQLSDRASMLAHSLFSGGADFEDILSTVRDLARADGVELPAVILDEMERLGVPA